MAVAAAATEKEGGEEGRSERASEGGRAGCLPACLDGGPHLGTGGSGGLRRGRPGRRAEGWAGPAAAGSELPAAFGRRDRVLWLPLLPRRRQPTRLGTEAPSEPLDRGGCYSNLHLHLASCHRPERTGEEGGGEGGARSGRGGAQREGKKGRGRGGEGRAPWKAAPRTGQPWEQLPEAGPGAKVGAFGARSQERRSRGAQLQAGKALGAWRGWGPRRRALQFGAGGARAGPPSQRGRKGGMDDGVGERRAQSGAGGGRPLGRPEPALGSAPRRQREAPPEPPLGHFGSSRGPPSTSARSKSSCARSVACRPPCYPRVRGPPEPHAGQEA